MNGDPSIGRRGVYWYDPNRGRAWPYDGTHGGDQELVQLFESESLFPVFDTLERLFRDGHYIKEQDGRWHLFAKDGEGVASGESVRKLCVNIVLAGI